MNALQLFQTGNDYQQIAASLHISEAEVEKQIHVLRKEKWERERKKKNRRQYQRDYQRRIRQEMREARAGA
jgi:biotin operon repressor